MVVLVNYKNEEDPIKNEGPGTLNKNQNKKKKKKMKGLECSQHFSHYKSMGIFPGNQGQLTLQSLVRSGRILNSFEMLWMSLLPAKIRKIQSKMKALECSQHFPHYNPMGAICCHGNKYSDPIWPKT